MEYLQLNNEVKMPMLGFGTFMINGEECEKSVKIKNRFLTLFLLFYNLFSNATNPANLMSPSFSI